MKRFLTFLLVFCIIISMLPATSAETTSKSGITIVYSPWGPGDVLKNVTDSYPLTNFTSYDDTLGFWRYVQASNNVDKYNVVRNNIEVFQMYNVPVNGWVAFAINVPVAGEYDVTLDWWKYPTKIISKGAMYIAPATEELSAVVNNSQYCVTDELTYTTASSKTVESWNFATAGEYYVVYQALANDNGKFMYPGVLTLNGGTGSVAMKVKMSVDDAELEIGDIAQASAIVYMSEETTKTDVTYSSSDESVAKVDPNTGVITAVGSGTTTITATYSDAIIGDIAGTTEVAVADLPESGVVVEYSPWGPGDVLKNETDSYPLTNFTSYNDTLGFWRYVQASNNVDKYNVVRNKTEVFSMWNVPVNGWVAFAINVPIAGCYDVTLNWWKYPTKVISKGAMYIAPATEELSTVVNNSQYCVADELTYTTASSKTVESWNFATAGEYYVVYQALADDNEKYMYPGVLTLNGGTDSVAMKVKMSVDDAELEIGDSAQASATVYMSDATIADNPVVTYSSSAPDIAEANETTGKVTGVSGGTATITATYNDAILGKVTDTVAVTVTAAPNEYEEAFGEDTYEVEENVNVNPEVGAVAYADGTTLSSANAGAVKNADGTYAVMAEKTVEDYTFRYWVRGLENNASGNKRIVSLENNFTYAPQKGDKNWLIAVYTKNGTATTEYFNANGQLIVGATDATLPIMPGYGKATGWKDHGNGIKEAIYGDVQSYLITVNGDEKSYNYGEAVLCTATAEKDGQLFLGWTKVRDGETEAELVSADIEYTFYAWEKCTVEAVYVDDKPVFTGDKRKILVDTFSLEGETVVMAEFIGFEDAVERGITLGSKDYTMTSKEASQFTLINDVNAAMTEISGYAILADGTKLVYNLK